MTTALYPAKIWKEENVFYVQFLDVENAFTYGNTLDEAKEMAADVLTTLFSYHIEKNIPIPAHSDKRGKDIYLIAPDAKIQAAILLQMASHQKSRKTAHPKIKFPRPNITLNQLQKAAKALGRNLVLELIKP